MTSGRLFRALSARWARTVPDRDGGFSTLEAVVVIPVVVIMTMISVQYVMVWHARNVAEAAARNGLRVARGYQATGPQGSASCTQYLDTVANKMLGQRSCTANRGGQTVVVTVHAKVMSVIPFGSFTVDESASGPVEVFNGGG
ncbi:TadE/TadG family type IV pilus assembly protein [uncultured Jatrophihabitans sp.]|uniref:TadE/TadG family type IV pilus assembly protein n=1 Tax=uncultured Jatrophihabitans sp. TaxID=1610747 RepID=UPI0035CACD38